MTPLEQRLTELGGAIAFPPTPELTVPAVVHARSRRPRRLVRIALVLAVLLAAGLSVLAVSPGARSALRDLIGLGGVSLVRVDELPRPGAPPGYMPGRAVTLDEARRAVDYELRLPEVGADRLPREVLLDDHVAGGAVSFVWCCEPSLLLTQFLGTSSIDYVQKLAVPATRVEETSVGGRAGYWIEGGRHTVAFIDSSGTFHDTPSRIAGNVLLWRDGAVTLRLEGRISKAEALAIAAGIR